MKLPVLTGKELVKILTKIPVHSGEEVDIGLLNKIIKKDLQISREEFLRYVR